MSIISLKRFFNISINFQKRSFSRLINKDDYLRTTYHGIYWDDGLVVFKVNKSVQEIYKNLAEFQKTLDKSAGNQHLQFTAEM